MQYVASLMHRARLEQTQNTHTHRHTYTQTHTKSHAKHKKHTKHTYAVLFDSNGHFDQTLAPSKSFKQQDQRSASRAPAGVCVSTGQLII